MFFSIIIPIYNVERFIHSGLHCISEQTFTDYEVILVDDGSTDGSPSLCDKAAAADNRIKVIHSLNEGVGSARNKGIEAACGDYIMFYDIDDILHNNALDIIYQRIKQFNDPELLVFSYSEIDQTYKTKKDYTFNQRLFRSNDELRVNYVDELSGVRFNNGFVWNKVYRRRFISEENVHFENLWIQQDEVFNIEIYKKVNTAAVLSDILYDYYVYTSGNIRSRFIPNRLNIYQRVRDALLSLEAEWHLDDSRFKSYVHGRYINSVITYLNFNLFHPDNPDAASGKLKELCKVVKSADVLLSVKNLKPTDMTGARLSRTLYYLSFKKQSPYLYLIARGIEFSISKVKLLRRLLLPRKGK